MQEVFKIKLLTKTSAWINLFWNVKDIIRKNLKLNPLFINSMSKNIQIRTKNGRSSGRSSSVTARQKQRWIFFSRRRMLPVPPYIWYRKKLQVVRKKELYISEKKITIHFPSHSTPSYSLLCCSNSSPTRFFFNSSKQVFCLLFGFLDFYCSTVRVLMELNIHNNLWWSFCADSIQVKYMYATECYIQILCIRK